MHQYLWQQILITYEKNTCRYPFSIKGSLRLKEALINILFTIYFDEKIKECTVKTE